MKSIISKKFAILLILVIGALFIASNLYRKNISIKNTTNPPLNTDQKIETSIEMRELFHKNVIYKKDISNTGAVGVNIVWENDNKSEFYIEEQRFLQELIISGIVTNNPELINKGIKIMDWGFKHQQVDGSFIGSDIFHSTSYFVEAVARSLIYLKNSSYANHYSKEITTYSKKLKKAAYWMISKDIWSRGTEGDNPLTHRYYIVGTGLGLTSKLVDDSLLYKFAKLRIEDGLKMQLKNGSNPEFNGNDTSYNMFSVFFAEPWIYYFPTDDLTPKLKNMVERAIKWERLRIGSYGEVSSEGNTRTNGQEKQCDGSIKRVDYYFISNALLSWGIYKEDSELISLGVKVYKFRYP